MIETIKSEGVRFSVVIFGSILASQFKVLFPVVLWLIIAMLLDYYSGVSASKYEKLKFPDDPTKGLSSKIGFIGIIKKTMYPVLIAVGLSVDFLIMHLSNALGITFPFPAFFGLMTSVFLLLNDNLSILENCVRMDMNIPPFLIKVANTLKVKTEVIVDNKDGSETPNYQEKK